MSDAYNRALKRLFKYRKIMSMSQEEISKIIGVTQSHYSKLELGKKVISYRELLNLYESGCDVDYIITGNTNMVTVLNEYVEKCEKVNRTEMLKLIIWVINQGIKLQSLELSNGKLIDYSKEFELIQEKTVDIVAEDNIWYAVRKANSLTQLEMAELLNVNIKKYRDIEKGNRNPDAQILTELYEGLGYPPSMMLSDSSMSLGYLNSIWDLFDENVKEKLLKIIRAGFELIQECQVQSSNQR